MVGHLVGGLGDSSVEGESVEGESGENPKKALICRRSANGDALFVQSLMNPALYAKGDVAMS